MYRTKYPGKWFPCKVDKWAALTVGRQFSILDTEPCRIDEVQVLSPTVLALLVTQEGRDDRTVILGMHRNQINTTTFQLDDIELI